MGSRARHKRRGCGPFGPNHRMSDGYHVQSAGCKIVHRLLLILGQKVERVIGPKKSRKVFQKVGAMFRNLPQGS